MKKNYKDLLVWQKAIELAPHVYRLVKKLPKEESFSLGSQIRRAVVSIASNIAEGQARGHKKEFLQYLNITKGSLAELHTQLIIAEKLDYFLSEEVREIEGEIDIISKMLYGLINSLQ